MSHDLDIADAHLVFNLMAPLHCLPSSDSGTGLEKSGKGAKPFTRRAFKLEVSLVMPFPTLERVSPLMCA